MRRTWGRISAIALAVGIAATLVACAPTQESPEDTNPLPAVCDRASALLADDPSAAKALIAEYRKPAIERLAAGVGASGDAKIAKACEDVWTAALVSKAPKTQPSAAEAAGKTWDSWVKQTLAPLATAVTWGLGAVALLIVLARLITPFGAWGRRTVRSQSRRVRRGAYSILLIAFGAFGFVASIALAWQPSWSIAFASAAVGGLGWCAYWLGARPRVTIRVTAAGGSASVPASTELARLVDELGAAPPGGIETPSPSDITQLSAATSKVSENAFVGVVVAVFDFVANVSPWSVEVQQSEDKNQLVSVHWNGHAIAHERVSAKALKLPDALITDDSMLRMVAAVIAFTIAGRYKDMTGLYGAQRWESVGLHSVARTPAAEESASALYREAVVLDTENRLAVTAYENELHREETEPDEIDTYLRTLENQISDLEVREKKEGEPSALRARTLVVWLSILRNRIAVGVEKGRPFKPATPDRDVTRLAALVDLVIEIAKAAERAPSPERDRLRRFAETLRARTAIGIERLVESGAYTEDQLEDVRQTTGAWFTVAKASNTRAVAYGYACYLAMKEDRGKDAEAELKEKLALALQDEKSAKWAPRDPELFRLRATHWAALHPAAPASVWDVEPLATHRKKLKAIGITEAAALAADPQDTRKHLALSRLEYRHLVQIARLAALLESKTPEPWKKDRVPSIFAALVAEKITSSEALLSAASDALMKPLEDSIRVVEPESTADSVQQLMTEWRK